MAALAAAAEAPLLVLVPTLEEAGRWAALLELMGWSSCQLYPTSEASPYEPFDPTSEITWGQLQVLSELLDLPAQPGPRRMAMVATERALQPHLPPPAVLQAQCLSLRKGDTVKGLARAIRASSPSSRHSFIKKPTVPRFMPNTGRMRPRPMASPYQLSMSTCSRQEAMHAWTGTDTRCPSPLDRA